MLAVIVLFGVYILPINSAPTTCSRFDFRFTREGQPGYFYKEFCSNICSPSRNQEYNVLCWSDKNVLKHCEKYVDCINQKPEPAPNEVNKFTKYGVPTIITTVGIAVAAVLTLVYKFGVIAKIRQKCERTAQERTTLQYQPEGANLVNGQTARIVEPTDQDSTGKLCPS